MHDLSHLPIHQDLTKAWSEILFLEADSDDMSSLWSSQLEVASKVPGITQVLYSAKLEFILR